MARDEYTSLKNSLVGRRGGRGTETASIDERSMANVSLTRLNESKKAVEEALLCLGDAEVLLRRATRLISHERELLPLFRVMAGTDDYPKSCPYNLIVAGMILLMNGTFDQRANSIFEVFQPTRPGLYDKTYLTDCVSLIIEVLNKLHLFPYKLASDELESLVLRYFADTRVSVALTQYEAKHFLSSLISRSKYHSDLFGLDRHLLFSTYQRQKMNVQLYYFDTYFC